LFIQGFLFISQSSTLSTKSSDSVASKSISVSEKHERWQMAVKSLFVASDKRSVALMTPAVAMLSYIVTLYLNTIDFSFVKLLPIGTSNT